MLLFDLLEVKINNQTGIGSVPDNANVDYKGLRVMLSPSKFLMLAEPLPPADNTELEDLIKQGQAIGSPFFIISIPDEWIDGDLSKSARIVGHEGRHRMSALYQAEGDAPIETHIFFTAGIRNRDLTQDIVARLNRDIISERNDLVIGPWFEPVPVLAHDESITEKWSNKYKRSIDCSNPKGFSQKAHCAARRKRKSHGKTSSRPVHEGKQMASKTPRAKTIVDGVIKTLMSKGRSRDEAIADLKKQVDSRFYEAVDVIADDAILNESLRDWFKEKWVRFGPDGKIRGDCARGSASEGKPKCLPKSKAQSLGKKGRKYAAAKKRREDPNPERKGAAINVSTKKKTNESVLNELDLLAPRTTYFKLGDGRWVKADYRGTNVPSGGGRTGTDMVSFASFKWVPAASVKALGLEHILAQPRAIGQGGANELAPNNNWQGNHPLSARSSNVVDINDMHPDDVPSGLKSKLAQWVQGNTQKQPVQEQYTCPKCGGPMFEASMINEKKDACYYKVKSRYKVWPSAYASGALVQCRKKGAKNWGTKSESISEEKTKSNGDAALTVFDIDETLFHTQAKVLVSKNGKIVKELTNQEFNSYVLGPDEKFDFSQFTDARLFHDTSEPIEAMWQHAKKTLDQIGRRSGSRVIIVTARSDFDDKETFLDTFRKHGLDIDKIHVHRAGNLNMPSAAAKKIIISKYLATKKFKLVRLFDDAESNLIAFLSLQDDFPDIEFQAWLVLEGGKLRRYE